MVKTNKSTIELNINKSINRMYDDQSAIIIFCVFFTLIPNSLSFFQNYYG